MKDKFISLYMSIAERVAEMSTAKRLKVGSVIVKDNNIIGYGWNGTPSGWDNDCEYRDYCLERDLTGEYFPDAEDTYPHQDSQGRYRLVTKPEVIHAEMNAIMKVSKSTESSQAATMFCTHAPCVNCAKLIYQSGITRLFYGNLYRDSSGLEMLKRGSIAVENYTHNNPNQPNG